jgi:putative pyruvate formate lyase activating enzyme
MEQYHPDAHVGKPKRANSDGKQEKEEVRYAELNRPVNNQEVSSIRKAAQEAGLWRFNDPPRHDGFAI